jgi:tRNA1(Val) A37 N6-methylase TrmN6
VNVHINKSRQHGISRKIQHFVSTSRFVNRCDFFAVYRPDRLVTLLCAMRNNGIEPKRLRAVVPSIGKKPSLILVEGKKDGKEGLVYENDLFIYIDSTHKVQTEEMNRIYSRFDGKKD